MGLDSKANLVWSRVPSGLQWCIFTVGVGAVFLQLIFLLMMMLEKPGWLDDTGRVKYISDALAMHQGIGAMLIMLFLVSSCVLSMSFLRYDVVHKYFFFMLLSLPISSGFSVVAYTNIHHPNEHMVSTMMLFISYAIVIWLLTPSTTFGALFQMCAL